MANNNENSKGYFMPVNAHLIGQTAKVYKYAKDVSAGNNNNGNGNGKTSMFTFSVAVQRGNSTDFLYCKAFGTLADKLNEYINVTTSDGKFKSRKVYLDGYLESYTAKENREVEGTVCEGQSVQIKTKSGKTVPVGIAGANLKVSVAPTTNWQLNVQHVHFCDSNKGEKSTSEVSEIQSSELDLDDDELDMADITGATANSENNTASPTAETATESSEDEDDGAFPF